MSYPQNQDSYVAKVDNFDDVMAGDINSLQNSIMAMQAFLGDWSQIGWLPAGETWTYASATTFTVAGNVVTKYPTGSKIKLTQTSTKYFYVLSASYSAPNTTITVIGGTAYTLTNAAITSPFVSYVESPQGFPSLLSWTPAVTYAGGTTDPTSLTFFNATFLIDRGYALVNFGANLVRGAGNRTSLSISLPIAYSSGSALAVIITFNGTISPVSFLQSTNQIYVANGNMTSDGYIWGTGYYRF